MWLITGALVHHKMAKSLKGCTREIRNENKFWSENQKGGDYSGDQDENGILTT
jgi:hypothetical protein